MPVAPLADAAVVDCDDVMLLLAGGELRTLTGVEATSYHEHVATCEACQALNAEPAEDEWRWLARVPADALEDRNLPVLPTVDPVVFDATELLASGGMGKITRAFDRRLGREVAIKETLDDDLRARFEREVRITARLQHPAIVPVYEAGTFPGGASFYTMRLVPGRNLQDAIADAETLPGRLALMPHLRALADALAYAHHRGVIHRDLKPGNVLVGEFGETVVIDWGLAKELDHPGDDAVIGSSGPRASAGPALTRVGAVIGTPCYMSPSQAAGGSVDATDDVYALGAMLYHLLAGTPPYWDSIAHDADALLAATIAGPPTPLAELAPDAPADLRAIAERAMSRAKEDRFPTARELVDELARFEAGQLLASRDYRLRDLVAHWWRRHRRAAIVGIVGIVVAIVLAIVWTRYRRAAEELALREHGTKLTALYSDVARHASQIDRHLLKFEAALEGLGTATMWALTSPEPAQPTPIFFADELAEHPLPDLDRSAYRWPVSVQYPVVALAPGADRQVVLPKLRRLAPLREHIREMVVAAAIGNTTPIAPAEIDPLLRMRRSPIDYAYIDLPEGSHMVWPGMAALRRDYDARKASFYVNSDHLRGTHWGSPYVDSTTDRDGDDLVLPCTRSVWSPTGDFLGVVGVEITVTKLVDTQLELPTRKALRASLVDGDGRKIIDSGDAGKRFAASGKDEAVALPAFDLPDIAEAIRDHKSSIVETVRDGRAIVVAFVRLDIIDWYYVVEVDAAGLGAPK